MMIGDSWPILASAVGACALMPLVIGTDRVGRDQPEGVQKLHITPTSRLGGAIIIVAYIVAWAVAVACRHAEAAPALTLALCAMPVIAAGLREDFLRPILPQTRLLAAVVAAALASIFSGGIIARLDLPFIDPLLKHLVVVIPVTWFMVAGACNAMNIIDGVNGLAAGTAVMMFSGIALVAGWSDDTLTQLEALSVAGALLGFMAWNYPRGRVFLGDAGAYFIGFVYAQLAIQLVARNDEVSAWFVILLAAYPIVETLFSIYRRKVVRRTESMKADALHLHSLIYRRAALPEERRRPEPDPLRANSRVAPRLWVHGALCLILALVFYSSTVLLILCLGGYAAFYVGRYRALVRFRRHGRRAVRVPRIVTSSLVKRTIAGR